MPIKKYQRLPIAVNAIRLTKRSAEEARRWCKGKLFSEKQCLGAKPRGTTISMDVATRRGMERAEEGDWIIQEPDGEFYVVSDERFQDLYIYDGWTDREDDEE